MITPRSKKQFIQILTLGNYAGFSMIKQDTKSNSVVCKAGHTYKAWIYTQLCLILAYQMYLAYQVWNLSSDPTSPTTTKISTLSITSTFWLLNCNHVVGLLWMKDYTCFINGYQRFMQNHVAQGHASGRTVRYMKIVSFIFIFAWITNTLNVFVNPTSPRVVTSLSDNPRGLSIPLKLAAAGYHFIANGFHLYSFCLQNATVYSWAHDVSIAMRNLKPSNGQYGCRSAVKFAKNYREFSILQANFKSLYAQWISMTNLAAQCAVILNLYIAVMFRAWRPLVLASAIGGGYKSFLEQTANPHEMSTMVLEQWRRSNYVTMPKWFPRFLRSCRHVPVPVGEFFYADKALVLTVCSNVINTAASLILAN